jgi:hypothetical protein
MQHENFDLLLTSGGFNQRMCLFHWQIQITHGEFLFLLVVSLLIL